MLTVELVPRTCWFSNIRDHVDKKTWDKLRRQTYAKANQICEACGGRGTKWPVECHEMWHYDDENHVQKLAGLTALCPACHEVKHIGLAGIRGRGDIARAHLAGVNKWTPERADEYLTQVWKVWKQRSRRQWKLDLTFLEQMGVEVEPKR